MRALSCSPVGLQAARHRSAFCPAIGPTCCCTSRPSHCLRQHECEPAGARGPVCALRQASNGTQGGFTRCATLCHGLPRFATLCISCHRHLHALLQRANAIPPLAPALFHSAHNRWQPIDCRHVRQEHCSLGPGDTQEPAARAPAVPNVSETRR